MTSDRVGARSWEKIAFPLSSIPNGVILSVFDQGIVSLSNFLTTVIAARTLAPDQFGMFSLFYATLLILSGVQNALITGPIRVLGVQKAGGGTTDYFQAQIYLQLTLGIAISLISVTALIASASAKSSVGISFSLCVFFVQLQELARAILATKLSIVSLLWLDVLTHSSRIVLVILLAATDAVTTTSLFLAIAIPCGITASIFLRFHRMGGLQLNVLLIRALENWLFGRWILVETFVYTISSQFYFYITAIMINIESVGALNAALSVLNLINVLLSGVMSFAIPVARQRLLNIGFNAWKSWLKRVGVALTMCVLVLWIAITVLARPLLSFTFSDFYAEYAYLIQIVGFSYVFRAVNTVLIAAYRTAGLPQVGSSAQLASAILSLLIAYPLIKTLGVGGAALGFVVTQIAWTLVYLYYLSIGSLSESRVLQRVN
jgi:O-antigen/teichoic acid export membrane protein